MNPIMILHKYKLFLLPFYQGIRVMEDLEQRSGNAQVVIGYQVETQCYIDY